MAGQDEEGHSQQGIGIDGGKKELGQIGHGKAHGKQENDDRSGGERDRQGRTDQKEQHHQRQTDISR